MLKKYLAITLLVLLGLSAASATCGNNILEAGESCEGFLDSSCLDNYCVCADTREYPRGYQNLGNSASASPGCDVGVSPLPSLVVGFGGSLLPRGESDLSQGVTDYTLCGVNRTGAVFSFAPDAPGPYYLTTCGSDITDLRFGVLDTGCTDLTCGGSPAQNPDPDCAGAQLIGPIAGDPLSQLVFVVYQATPVNPSGRILVTAFSGKNRLCAPCSSNFCNSAQCGDGVISGSEECEYGATCDSCQCESFLGSSLAVEADFPRVAAQTGTSCASPIIQLPYPDTSVRPFVFGTTGGAAQLGDRYGREESAYFSYVAGQDGFHTVQLCQPTENAQEAWADLALQVLDSTCGSSLASPDQDLPIVQLGDCAVPTNALVLGTFDFDLRGASLFGNFGCGQTAAGVFYQYTVPAGQSDYYSLVVPLFNNGSVIMSPQVSMFDSSCVGEVACDTAVGGAASGVFAFLKEGLTYNFRISSVNNVAIHNATFTRHASAIEARNAVSIAKGISVSTQATNVEQCRVVSVDMTANQTYVLRAGTKEPGMPVQIRVQLDLCGSDIPGLNCPQGPELTPSGVTTCGSATVHSLNLDEGVAIPVRSARRPVTTACDPQGLDDDFTSWRAQPNAYVAFTAPTTDRYRVGDCRFPFAVNLLADDCETPLFCKFGCVDEFDLEEGTTYIFWIRPLYSSWTNLEQDLIWTGTIRYVTDDGGFAPPDLRDCTATCGDGVTAPLMEQCDEIDPACTDCRCAEGTWAWQQIFALKKRGGWGWGAPLEAVIPGYDHYVNTLTSLPSYAEFTYCESVQGTNMSCPECIPLCGDGILHSSEQCDDGNLMNDDGCNENCTLESGWDCARGRSNIPIELGGLCALAEPLLQVREGEVLMGAHNFEPIPSSCLSPDSDRAYYVYFVPEEDGWYSISTCGSYRDQRIAVFEGDCDPQSCPDVSDGCRNKAWGLVANFTYVIEVSSNDPSEFVLLVEQVTLAQNPPSSWWSNFGDVVDPVADTGPLVENWADAMRGLNYAPGFSLDDYTVCTPACGDSQLVGKEECEVADPDCTDCRCDYGYYSTLNYGQRLQKRGGGGSSWSSWWSWQWQSQSSFIDLLSAFESCTPSTCPRCAPLCGDGIVAGNEECDDANRNDNDGCSSSCLLETGFACSADSEITTTISCDQDEWDLFGAVCERDGCGPSGSGVYLEGSSLAISSPVFVTQGSLLTFHISEGSLQNDACTAASADQRQYYDISYSYDGVSFHTIWEDRDYVVRSALSPAQRQLAFNWPFYDATIYLSIRPIVLSPSLTDPTIPWSFESFTVDLLGNCRPVCGDGLVVGYEQCDGTAGCTDQCYCQPGTFPDSTTGDCLATCGDGVVAFGIEECDSDDSWCTNCVLAPGYECYPDTRTLSCFSQQPAPVHRVLEGQTVTVTPHVNGHTPVCDISDNYNVDTPVVFLEFIPGADGDYWVTCPSRTTDLNFEIGIISVFARNGDGCDAYPRCYRCGTNSATQTTTPVVKFSLDAGSPYVFAITRNLQGWDQSFQPYNVTVYQENDDTADGRSDPVPSAICGAVCGDGMIAGNEECDGGVGCTPECKCDYGFSSTGGVNCTSSCGDGLVALPVEECDDGNNTPNDGCVNCIVQDGWVCAGGGDARLCEGAAPLLLVENGKSEPFELGHTSGNPGCFGEASTDQWFQFTAAASGFYRASLVSDDLQYVRALSVYEGTCVVTECGLTNVEFFARRNQVIILQAQFNTDQPRAAESYQLNVDLTMASSLQGTPQCITDCGDGIRTLPEECDSDAGCSDRCRCDTLRGYAAGAVAGCVSRCQDGLLADDEECDVGPSANASGCTNCIVDAGFSCANHAYNLFPTRCGEIPNGFVADGISGCSSCHSDQGLRFGQHGETTEFISPSVPYARGSLVSFRIEANVGSCTALSTSAPLTFSYSLNRDGQWRIFDTQSIAQGFEATMVYEVGLDFQVLPIPDEIQFRVAMPGGRAQWSLTGFGLNSPSTCTAIVESSAEEATTLPAQTTPAATGAQASGSAQGNSGDYECVLRSDCEAGQECLNNECLALTGATTLGVAACLVVALL